MKTGTPAPVPARRPLRGQSIIEFVIGATVLLLMTIAFFESHRLHGLALRMSSSCREGGRIFIAEKIAPTPGVDYPNSPTALAALDSEVKTRVYEKIKDMVAPSKLQTKGKVFISILKRYDPNSDTMDYSNATQTDDDKVKIEFQFKYPANSITVSSKIGSTGSVIPTSILSLDALRVEERTVCVEIFHETGLLNASKSLLDILNFNYLYDRSVF